MTEGRTLNLQRPGVPWVERDGRPAAPATPPAAKPKPKAEPDPDPIVVVRRQWNDWCRGTVRLSDLRHPHWSRVSGGVRSIAPRPFIHAYASCDLVEGDIPHSCLHGQGPHSIKVCVVQKDNDRATIRALKGIAGPLDEQLC